MGYYSYKKGGVGVIRFLLLQPLMDKRGLNKNFKSIILTVLVISLYLFPNFASAVSVYITSDKSSYENSEVVKFDASVDVDSGESVPVKKLTLKVNDTLKTCEFRPDGTFITDCSNLEITAKKLYTNGYGYGYSYGYGYGYGEEFGTFNTSFDFGYGYGSGYGYGNGYGYDENLVVTRQADMDKLNDAYKKLKDSLDSSLWDDSSHPNKETGNETFDKEKDAVEILQQILDDSDSRLSKKDVRDLAKRIADADRNIALVAIQDAEDSGGNEGLIDEANAELALGDSALADGDYAGAIEHYKNAWNKAIEAQEEVD